MTLALARLDQSIISYGKTVLTALGVVADALGAYETVLVCPGAANADPDHAPSITFHPAQINESAIAELPAKVRKPLANAPSSHAAT